MLEAISKRQSIRKYKNQKLEKEEIINLLKAAMRAPTARNKQSWRFVVIEDRDLLDDISQSDPSYGMMKTAPAAILVLSDSTITPYEFCLEDAAIAIENMLLEAYDNGLGTCYCAIIPKESAMNYFKDKFKIQEGLLPIAIVSVGYPDEVKPIEDRFDENKIFWQ